MLYPFCLRRLLLAACFALIPAVAARAQTSAAPAPTPVPTLEQRLASLEAYINNADPTTALKDKAGKSPRA
jgi:hypothetical protein